MTQHVLAPPLTAHLATHAAPRHTRGRYSEKEASQLMRQMGQAIEWLRAQGVCHRDLKPENILLEDEPSGVPVRPPPLPLRPPPPPLPLRPPPLPLRPPLRRPPLR